MTTLAIRQKLIAYLAHADDSKVKAVYTLLEREIQEEDTFILSEEQSLNFQLEINQRGAWQLKLRRGVSASYRLAKAKTLAIGGKSNWRAPAIDILINLSA